jgi:hypothetical protein
MTNTFRWSLLSDFYFMLKDSNQRLALAAGGRAGIRLGSRKNSKPEKCQKTAQSPTSPLHALLGVFVLCKTRWLKKDNSANMTRFYTTLFFNR